MAVTKCTKCGHVTASSDKGCHKCGMGQEKETPKEKKAEGGKEEKY